MKYELGKNQELELFGSCSKDWSIMEHGAWTVESTGVEVKGVTKVLHQKKKSFVE